MPALDELLPLVKCAEVLARKYDVVVTNPPYMGGSGMSAKLADFLKKHFTNSKSDLFASFIERGNEMVKAHGGDTFAFDDLDSLIPPVNTIFVIADKAGFVTNVDTLGLYQAINVIGATESGEINRYVGLDILVREGDRIKEGDKLAKIYYSITDPNFASAVTCIRKCFNIGKTRPELNPLIKKIIF